MCDGTLLIKYVRKMWSNIIKREQKNVDPPIPPGINMFLNTMYTFLDMERKYQLISYLATMLL